MPMVTQGLTFKVIRLYPEAPRCAWALLVSTSGFKCALAGDRSDFLRGSAGGSGRGILLQFLLDASCSQILGWDSDLSLPASRGRILRLVWNLVPMLLF